MSSTPDALAGVAVGTTGNTAYTPSQFLADIYGISTEAVASAPLLLARGDPGKTTYAQGPAGDASFSGQLQTARGVTNPVPTTIGATQNDVRSLRDAMSWVQKLDAGQVSNLASRLYAAGLYHPSNYSKGGKPPNGKVVDDQMQYAALQLFQAVVAQNTTHPGSEKSMSEILDERIKAGAGQSLIDQAASQQKGSVYRVTTDDPATLRATVTKTAQAILGRAVTDDEQNALVERMLKAERSPQEAAINAGQTADTGSDVRLATAQVDAQAQLEEQLRAQHPDQAGAYDQLNYYNMLTKMLGGGGAQ